MVFQLNTDYVRSNRGMLVSAETVSTKILQDKISIIYNDIFALPNNAYNLFHHYCGISGSRRYWWINSISNALWVYVISTLVNILPLRNPGASKCFECLPGSENEDVIPRICGKYQYFDGFYYLSLKYDKD